MRYAQIFEVARHDGDRAGATHAQTAALQTDVRRRATAVEGTVLFIFQPAEEGPSLFTSASGKICGVKLMLEEGAFKDLKPDAVFGLHVMPGPLAQISYRTGATAASSDDLEITVTGRQGHDGMPWNTIDPVTTSALVITGLQTVVSRRANLTQSPAVLTIGTINGGTRASATRISGRSAHACDQSRVVVARLFCSG